MSIVVTESSEEIDGRGGVILHAGDTFGVREFHYLHISLVKHDGNTCHTFIHRQGAELLNDGKRTTTCTATEFAELLVISKSVSENFSLMSSWKIV